MRESLIEAHLVKRVKAMGGHAYKFVSPGRVGVPDRMVVLPGRLIFVELKATGEVAKPHQLREHERLRLLGQMVLVLDSAAAVDEWLGAAV